ncbi:MAG: ABC transporter permease [Gammaproteobacteria bacterium]|nr:ABC transporter permease [Gammaproteobacteria bacterium]
MSFQQTLNTLNIAFKMLINSRKKFIGMVVGATLSAFIIMQQPSIYQGIKDRLVAHIQYITDADLWVMDSNSVAFHHPTPFPPGEIYRVRSVPGVLWAVQVYRNRYPLIHPETGKLMTWSFIGVDPDTLIGLPKTMLAGKRDSLHHSNAIIVDGYSLKQMETPSKRTIKIGEEMNDAVHTWTITGITKPLRTYETEPTAYIASNHMPKLSTLSSFILVKVKPTFDVHQIATDIHNRTGYDVLTPAEFSNRTTNFFRDSTPIVIGFIVTAVIGFFIGMVIMWQIFSNFILTHIHQFGMLKMLGTSNWLLTKMVLFQVLITGGLGYLMGLFLTILFGLCSYDTIIAFRLTWQIALQGVLGTLVVVLFSSYFSILKIIRLDSVELCQDLN